MDERQRNQTVAESISREFEWNGQRFEEGEWVALLDGEVVAVAANLDAALRALREIDSHPERGMLVQVSPPVTDVVRQRSL